MRSRIITLLVGLALPATAWWGTTPPASAGSGLPNSVAAIGDSVTRATNVCCWWGDHPRHSWSTGGAWFDGVQSHYERIRGVNSAIEGHNHNDATRGAKMARAPSQAATAVSQGAEYVTFMMGANDACTSSRQTMTPVQNFRAQFQQAMETLSAGLPEARVFVSSIPNIHRLWAVYHDSVLARSVWRVAQICQSMLAASNTEADRQAVLARIGAFNDVLAQGCARFSNCRFDDYAVFNFQFTRSNVSKLDFFHPNLSGQANLASLTWAKSWWPAV